MLSTVDAVIEALDGPAATARLTGVGASAVSNWSARGKISQENFFVIKDALDAKGLEVSPAVFGFKLNEEART